jgi:RNA polymerase sigma factor (sigma-70 family)
MASDRDSGTRAKESGSRYQHAPGPGAERQNGAAHPRPVIPASNGSAANGHLDRPDVYPLELRNLLHATDAVSRNVAWDVFVAQHSRLILHVARKVMAAPESSMDAYAHVLERLRREDCRALTAYSPDGRSRFTTWLVVVARRMCVDFYRQTHGRPRGEQPGATTLMEREARQRLMSFAGMNGSLAHVIDNQSLGPEGALRSEQLHAALQAAVSTLTPDDRLLLKLRFYDELPARKIATVLAFPSPFHVYRRLNSVYEELRRRLEANGVVDSSP